MNESEIRTARYAEAVDDASPAARTRRVMAVADAEIAAQVEAAVSVVRAELDAEVERNTVAAEAAIDHANVLRMTAESDLRALREKVAKVEALADAWEQSGWDDCRELGWHKRECPQVATVVTPSAEDGA